MLVLLSFFAISVVYHGDCIISDDGVMNSLIQRIVINTRQLHIIAHPINNDTYTKSSSSSSLLRNESYHYLSNNSHNQMEQSNYKGIFFDDEEMISQHHIHSVNQSRRSLKGTIPKVGTYLLLQTYPHDSNAFTQGLIKFDIINSKTKQTIHVTMEGTGLYGKSELRYVNIVKGTVLQKYSIGKQYFGEGIAHYLYYPNNNKKLKPKQRIIQITWLEKTAFIYEVFSNNVSSTNPILFSSKPIQTFQFSTTNGEGWGITYRSDQHIFYVTDGSSYINIWNASTFKTIRTVQVKQGVNNVAVTNLNEIEYDPVTQTILANIWQTDKIIRINPNNGIVQSIYDLSKLYINRLQTSDVLNGIALSHNFITRKNNEIWVTGKLWPNIYRIQLIN